MSIAIDSKQENPLHFRLAHTVPINPHEHIHLNEQLTSNIYTTFVRTISKTPNI